MSPPALPYGWLALGLALAAFGAVASVWFGVGCAVGLLAGVGL